MLNEKINNYLAYLIIFLGFSYSCFIGFKYLEKYDVYKNINGNIENTYFFEKEGGTPTFWEEASKIKEEIKNKSFFSTGNKYEFKYLPSRLIYFYYELVGDEIKTIDKNSNQKIFKKNNNKFGLIFIQNLLYSFSLIFLFYSFKKYFFNYKYFFFLSTLFFLSFEPTLNQWNRVLYSETIFFCLQLLTISLLISYNDKSSYKKTILIGIVLSLMYLQRTVSIYYLAIVVMYFYIFFRRKFNLNIAIILLIYLCTHLFIGYNNLKRDGKFYFYPIIAKEDMYGYFIPKILKYHQDDDFVNNFETRHDKINNYLKKNNLASESEIDIEKRINLSNENFLKSIDLISNYPFNSLKEYSISFSHFFLLKPNEVYFLFENKITYSGKFYLSKKFKDELPLKIFYSLMIYVICIIGFLYFMKKKDYKIIFLLVSSILYFSLPVVWHKQSSYLSPILIYLSIFFGSGLSQIFDKVKFYRK